MEDLSPEIIASLRAGARSICRYGWKAEECESAALERAVHHRPDNGKFAYTLGKWAAASELRTLNQTRKLNTLQEKTWPVDEQGIVWEPMYEDRGFEDLEQKDDLEHRLAGVKDKRLRRIAYDLADGYTKNEIAKREGVDPSRISVLLRRLRKDISL